MKKSEFLDYLKMHIDRTAAKKDPITTAGAIYFISKQYPIIAGNNRTYIKIIKEVKKHLVANFQWSMVEVHACFCRLNRLSKYL